MFNKFSHIIRLEMIKFDCKLRASILESRKARYPPIKSAILKIYIYFQQDMFRNIPDKSAFYKCGINASVNLLNNLSCDKFSQFL